MIGSNILQLNPRTMEAAVEHWLNTTQLKTPCTVVSVGHDAGKNVFAVLIKESEPPVNKTDG